MASFIGRAEQLFVRELYTIDEVVAFMKRDEMAVIGFFPPSPRWIVWRKDPNLDLFQKAMNGGLYAYTYVTHTHTETHPADDAFDPISDNLRWSAMALF